MKRVNVIFKLKLLKGWSFEMRRYTSMGFTITFSLVKNGAFVYNLTLDKHL